MAPLNHITTSKASPPLETTRAAARSTVEASPEPNRAPEAADQVAADAASSPTPIDEPTTRQLVEEMRQAIAGTPAAPYSVAFRPRESGSGYIIEIRDEEGELVKQFPPEKILNLSGKMAELKGMVVDEAT